jgi:hypothetical protein
MDFPIFFYKYGPSLIGHVFPTFFLDLNLQRVY